jgi:Xaa-Pro aminopeptidase
MTPAGDRRIERLAQELRERDVGCLIVSAAANVRYLTGYTGSNGVAVIAAAGSGEQHLFLTDFRYETQAALEVGAHAPSCERVVVTGDLVQAAGSLLAEGRPQRVGFEAQHLSVARHGRLVEALLEGEGFEPVACGGAVERLREVKEPEERRRIAAAAQLADQALREILEDGLIGRSERDVAIDLETRMRRLGAEAPSFPSIVASGTHGALPHAQPRAEPIPAGTLVTIDWGCILDGYCSDCTRTYAAGPVSEHHREIYELVLAAQLSGLDAVRAGRSGKEVDALAREVIEDAGYGERFGHGLGHGVGIEIHEGPRLSRTAGDEPLVEGNVLTVEPGIYLPGDLGVRIEDLVVVDGQGPAALTLLPKELTVLS